MKAKTEILSHLAIAVLSLVLGVAAVVTYEGAEKAAVAFFTVGWALGNTYKTWAYWK